MVLYTVFVLLVGISIGQECNLPSLKNFVQEMIRFNQPKQPDEQGYFQSIQSIMDSIWKKKD